MVSSLVKDFIAGAAAVGAEVHECRDAGEARALVSRLLKEGGFKNLLVASDVQDFVAGEVSWPIFSPAKREQYLAAGAGLVRGDYGAGATGTLVHLDRNEEDKLVWTLPEVCFCVLEAGRIVTRLEELAAIFSGHLLGGMAESPQVSLVTGPSRTADIEGQLTLGVQGPKRLVILLIKGGGLSDR